MPLVVNGEAIDDSLIREEANNLRPSYYQMMDGGDPIDLEIQLRDWSRENVIERVLLRQAAPDGDIEKLLERIGSAAPAPKPKEAADYYKTHKDDFFLPEMARVSHILETVDDGHPEPAALAAIERTQADLGRGLLFGSLAKELGWIPRGRIAGDLEQEIFSLELNQVSGILRSRAGYHIVRVEERRPGGIPPFPEVREHIEGLLLRARQQEAIEKFVDSLRAKAQIAKT